jgi:hypothetical protein
MTNEEKILAFDRLHNYYVDYCKKLPIASANCGFKKEIGETYTMKSELRIDGMVNIFLTKLETNVWSTKHFQVSYKEFEEKFNIKSYNILVEDRNINTAIRLLGISYIEVDGMYRFIICP